MTLLWVTLYSFLLAPLAPLWAQSSLPVAEGGAAPPQIQHEPFEKATPAGEPLDIEAVIVSTAKVDEALLLYRRIGASGYTSLRMKHRGEGRYSAKIPSKEVLPPGIEYFIKATDISGNSTTYGQPLLPGVRRLVPLTVQVERTPLDDQAFTEQIFPPEEPSSVQKTASAGNPWYQKWWVWTIVGAVAAGVAVASSGGHGKGGDAGGGAPATGTLTISGPVPKSP
jgi:hypothetical protein